jgi:hypothetical protein
LFISDYNVKPSKICGTNVAEFSLLYRLFGDGVYTLFRDVEGRGYIVHQYIAYLGMEKGGVTLSVRRSTSVSQLYRLFGDGEGRGYTVCTSVNICQSNQWNSVARMSQNFHHTLYISDYNVSPMEIFGTIVAEFSLFYYISN